MVIIRSSIAILVYGCAALASAATLGLNGPQAPGQTSGSAQPAADWQLVPMAGPVAQLSATLESMQFKPLQASPEVGDARPELADIRRGAHDEAEHTAAPANLKTPVDTELAGRGKMQRFADALTRGVDAVADAAMCAGKVTLSQMAPMLGFDMTHSRQKTSGFKWVADLGMAQTLSLQSPQFATSNPTLNAAMARDAHFEPSAGQEQANRWQPAATLGLSYGFE